MTSSIAIVGTACHYAEADSPTRLWENLLAGRCSFRRLPPERLRLEDYLSSDRQLADGIYSTEAAVIADWEFDRVKFRVAGSSHRTVDPAHWLALDVAHRALADAGYAEGDGLPSARTGVLVGNTLTGEFSRANLMRLRWPYVRRTVQATLAEQGFDGEQQRAFLEALEPRYKEPFPAMTEESLAGGLANTIAGRICNHFDLHGGGFVVDGACASSLLAIAQACSALIAGDLDVAVVGGVDLSLDPFELVGFARNGALSSGEMRVYDRHSEGFIPGEGCGFVVLMRTADALATGRRVRARIRGWGISSDGSGGLTRPSIAGQVLALERAYERAGLAASEMAYFEGHGTGTPVGDATELRALGQMVERSRVTRQRPAVGSVKALIGHTKAASGVAGVLKAVGILRHQLLPPTFGCQHPHPELAAVDAPLRRLEEAELWTGDRPCAVGVSGMGFGGLNVHLVLDRDDDARRGGFKPRECLLLDSPQDAELILIRADDRASLGQRVEALRQQAAHLSRAELTDLAVALAEQAAEGSWRAAIVAARPAELVQGLETLAGWLAAGETQRLAIRQGVFLGARGKAPSLGLLFPGQGAPSYRGGGAWCRRFASLRPLWRDLSAVSDRPDDNMDDDTTSTAVAQPSIIANSLAALTLLDQLGLEGALAIGHSLGELSALAWARSLSEEAALRLAQERGKAMELTPADGAMYSLAATPQRVARWLEGRPVTIAAYNQPSSTVISGPLSDVEEVAALAQKAGYTARRLRVSRAFHSPAMTPAVDRLAAAIEPLELRCPLRTVLSTVTGEALTCDADLPRLLLDQLHCPVLFQQALEAARGRVDLWLEVGPGQTLGGLLGPEDAPVISLDAGGESLRGLLLAAAATFALGAPLETAVLFEERFSRPFDSSQPHRFLANPCERAPLPEASPFEIETPAEAEPSSAAPLRFPAVLEKGDSAIESDEDLLSLVQRHVARRTELPLKAVRPEQRLLSDLHLNSLAVGQLVAAVGKELGLPASAAPTEYADATVREVAEALDERRRLGGETPADATLPEGVESWIRSFAVDWVERPLRQVSSTPGNGNWQLITSPDHPLAASLRRLLAATAGGGVVLCLPEVRSPGPDRAWIELCLSAARLARTAPDRRFIVVQHGGWASGFARTFRLEYPRITTAVIDLPFDLARAAERVLAEILSCNDFISVRYSAEGVRYQPTWRVLELEPQQDFPLDAGDVVLVTGGGKGIGAECALAIARQSGARLALLGRSEPHEDNELAERLQRFKTAGVAARYAVADVTDATSLGRAVEQLESELGPVTAVIHAAGVNRPRAISQLDADAFAATLAPKILGLHHLLAAIDPRRLRLFLAFGSVIARTGLPGEADYAVANEGLALLTENLQQHLPAGRALVLEWSVWAGIGMGERLGRLESLAHRGITPIPVDRGVEILLQLLRSATPSSVVVSGRLSDLSTLRTVEKELPLLRFLEQPRLHVPGVELISEVELSAETDPYLSDHVLDGDPLFPAVMGLEAMAQVAMALAETHHRPIFENVRFSRSIAVPKGQRVILRLAALQQRSGVIDVVVRCSASAFKADHFKARCRFDRPDVPAPLEDCLPASGHLGIDPDREFYGPLFFHRGRFQRLRDYRWLHARECVAEIDPPGEATSDRNSRRGAEPWFGGFLPNALTLGDPGARDAALHAIQACIPQTTVLPIGVEEVISRGLGSGSQLLVSARERSQKGATLTYDLQIADVDGVVLESWIGLELRMISSTADRSPSSVSLVGPYIERCLAELLPGAELSIALFGKGESSARTTRDGLARVFAWPAQLAYRGDGRPEIHPEEEEAPSWQLSVAHAGELTLAVAGPGAVGCDLEQILTGSEEEWRDLLGSLITLAQRIAEDFGEDLNHAATRVWTAIECLKKAGCPCDRPLTVERSVKDQGVVLSSGKHRVLSDFLCIGDGEYALAVSAEPAAVDQQLKPWSEARAVAI